MANAQLMFASIIRRRSKGMELGGDSESTAKRGGKGAGKDGMTSFRH